MVRYFSDNDMLFSGEKTDDWIMVWAGAGSESYNCYTQFLALATGGYAVFQNCYIEYDYEGRSSLDETMVMFVQAKKPTREECKRAFKTWLDTTCAWRWKD